MDTYLAQLRSAIDRADQLYHGSGKTTITDTEYDAMKAELRQQCPEDIRLTRVGMPYGAEELRNKVKHTIAAGSLDNVDGGISGLADWYASMQDKTGVESLDLMASLKIDGATAVAYYEDGNLKRVLTRGNGEVGEDITTNAVKWQWMPTSLPIDASVVVRGEVVLYRADFDAIMKEDGVPEEDISNPRNEGNGTVRRTDGRNNERMRFIAFNLHDAHGNQFELDMGEKFETLQAFGFKVVDHMFVGNMSAETAIGAVEKWFEQTEALRPSLDYEIDGMVVGLDNFEFQKRLTVSRKDELRPKHTRAIKFTSFKSTTTIKDVLITVGHTGSLIPTAELETVRIGGANVSHALLNNWNEIERLGVAIGDEVEVELAGDIIPKVTRLIKEGANRQIIEEPEEFNGYKTTRMHRGKEGAITYLVGAGDTLEVKRSKVKKWIGSSRKGVGILGVGDSVLEALTNGDDPLVETPADLYRLNAAKIKDLQIGTSSSGSPIRLGESRADKIMSEIEKSKNLDLPKFLGSLGVDLLGRRRVEQFIEDYELCTLGDWLDETKTNVISGNTTREAIQKGLKDIEPLIEELLAVGVVVAEALTKTIKEMRPELAEGEVQVGGLVAGKAFCFTGTRELMDEVQAAGGVIKSGVSKNCDYLVQKDPTSQSNKTRKAEECGTDVIGIDFLRRVLAGEAEL